MRLLLVFFILSSGCMSLRPQYRRFTFTMNGESELSQESVEECDKLDSKVTGWTVGSIVAGGAAAGGTLGTSLTDNVAARWSLSGVALAFSTVGSVGSYLATKYAQRYTHKCTDNKGAAPK